MILKALQTRACAALCLQAGLLLAAGVVSTPAAGRGRHGRAHSSPGVKEVDEDLRAPAPSADLGDSMRGFDAAFDSWLASKEKLKSETGLDFWMQVSNFGQWGSQSGAPQVANVVYAPTVVWNAIRNPDIGSGAFTLGFQQYRYWTANDTIDQRN